ncbi:MAG: DUF4349 domain-containing protein [Bacteroidota bacterium]|nr:DUF4349 domain-containing protein [Bacteroidota bacterium]
MKNFRNVLPAIVLAGIFIYSCSTGDRGYYNEAKETRMMDSTASVNSPYEEQENEKSLGFKSANKPASDQLLSLSATSQTETKSPEYQNFVYLMNSTAARPTRLDSTHRFIRKAEMHFRVKNVAFTSYQVEDLAARFDGYVADTKLSSQLQSSTEKPVSADSSLQTMRFVVTNIIVLRVPVENLDTTLKSLVKYIDYLDYRNINTNDITLEMLANRLESARIAKFNQRLAFSIDNKSGKLPDVQGAEESMLNQQANSDNALIENLRKDDQVKYSTITLSIYQPQTIRQELVAREKNIDEYEPGLGSKLAASLSGGWRGLQTVIIGIVMLWPLWLIGGVVWIVIRRLVKKSKQA